LSSPPPKKTKKDYDKQEISLKKIYGVDCGRCL
jgi:hypothetical protein